MNIRTEQPVQIFIPREASQLALSFASQQDTVWKAKRIFRNTLAVYAVSTYLNLLQIENEPEQSALWQSESRFLIDTSDLLVPSYGHIECRPLDSGETEFQRPDTVEVTCRGYVVVQFSTSVLESREIPEIDAVTLLGFVKASQVPDGQETVPVSKLESLESLLEDISLIESWEELTRSSDPTVLLFEKVLGDQKNQFLDLLDTLIRRNTDQTERDHEVANFLLPLASNLRSIKRADAIGCSPSIEPEMDLLGQNDVFDLLDQLWLKLGLD